MAGNEVRKLAIATSHPTEKLLTNLGLRSQDGSCPFILAPAPAATPIQTDARTGALRAPITARRAAAENARKALEDARG